MVAAFFVSPFGESVDYLLGSLMAAFLLAAAGCAPNLVKDGGTQEQADRDWEECQKIAAEDRGAVEPGGMTGWWKRHTYAKMKAEECMIQRGWRQGF
jgi:hypothetical protein